MYVEKQRIYTINVSRVRDSVTTVTGPQSRGDPVTLKGGGDCCICTTF